MTWQAMAHGAYVNWGQPEPSSPLCPLDPYLVWADGSGFSAYGGVPGDGKLPTLIELKAGKTVTDLIAQSGGGLDLTDIPGAYRAEGTVPKFLTAWPNAAFFKCLASTLADVVERAEISMPVVPERPRFQPPSAPHCGQAPQRGMARKILLGVIDDGCAFAHYRLRDAQGHTRVHRLWDQDSHGAFIHQGQVPEDFGRGHEVTGRQLQSLIDAFTQGKALDENACYGAAGYDRLNRAATHGAHVTDVLAGAQPASSRVGTRTEPPTWALANDAASSDDAGIVFVQLPRACLQDPSGAWLDLHVLDGLRYILSCADSHTKQVVVNLSFGPQRGPNDGTGMLEKAFEALSAEFPRLTLSLAAGNSFSERGHATFTLQAQSSQTLHWHVMPADETPSFVQLWLPPGATQVKVMITPPGIDPSPWISAGDAVAWPDAANPACGIVFAPRTARGTLGTMALVALTPATSFRPNAALAPHGLWKIEIENSASSALAAPIHVWIDRDDFNLGTLVRGRQSHFVDPEYDPLRYLKAATDDTPGSQALVRRRGTLTGIATGKGAVVAAGYRHSDKQHLPYSSAGPTRDAKGGPDIAAATDESRSLPGLLAAGTRGASVVRLIGTSTAAPQVARWVADGKTQGLEAARHGDRQCLGKGLLPLCITSGRAAS
jgi:Subtilase family